MCCCQFDMLKDQWSPALTAAKFLHILPARLFDIVVDRDECGDVALRLQLEVRLPFGMVA